MEKTFGISLVVLVIALIALGIAVASYTKAPEVTKINITEAQPSEAIYKGPTYTGTSNGFIITFENGKKIYFSGDTALFGDMKFVIGEYYKPDIAFLTAGDTFTMDPVDAAFATTWINPKYAIPYHYHTFAMVVQDANEFVSEVNKHRQEGRTRAEPVVLEYGAEQTLEGVRITWLGHGTFLFESPTGIRILLDPWLTGNPDCPATYKDFGNFGKIDLILITHGHLDHWDLDDLKELVRLYNPPILTQYELALYLQQLGITSPIALMNKGGKITKDLLGQQGITANMPAGMEIMLVYADHSSSPP
jgi:L-ascorbate metabolism protein UlaG (beta-lactamase superfamily)